MRFPRPPCYGKKFEILLGRVGRKLLRSDSPVWWTTHFRFMFPYCHNAKAALASPHSEPNNDRFRCSNRNSIKQSFFAALVLLLICALPLLLWPRSSFDALDAIKVFIENNFGVVYLWAASGTLAFVIWIAVSRHGRIRLGYSEPQFSTFSWVSMLFCAGVGTGVLYWGTIEWAYYFDSPPTGIAGSQYGPPPSGASTYGMFHWGITGWSFLRLGDSCHRLFILCPEDSSHAPKCILSSVARTSGGRCRGKSPGCFVHGGAPWFLGDFPGAGGRR